MWRAWLRRGGFIGSWWGNRRERDYWRDPGLFIHQYSVLQAETRAQSCDRYGSGTLPLLSSAFRRSHFSRQVPPSATTREILAAKSGTVGEKYFQLPRKCRDLLHAENLRHGTDGFTSPPKEGVLRIYALKIRRLRPGLNPQTWVLDHRSRHELRIH